MNPAGLGDSWVCGSRLLRGFGLQRLDQVLDRAIKDVAELDDFGDRFESHVAFFPGLDRAFGDLEGEGDLALFQATGFAAGFDVGDVGNLGGFGGRWHDFDQGFDGAIQQVAEGDDALQVGDTGAATFPVLDTGFGHLQGDRQFTLSHPGIFTLGCNIGNVDKLSGFGGHDVGMGRVDGWRHAEQFS
jgi:hypothetical protein